MTTKITFNPGYSPATGGVIFSISDQTTLIGAYDAPAKVKFNSTNFATITYSTYARYPPVCKVCGKEEVFTGGELVWVEGLCKDCLGWTWTWIQKGLKVS